LCSGEWLIVTSSDCIFAALFVHHPWLMMMHHIRDVFFYCFSRLCLGLQRVSAGTQGWLLPGGNQQFATPAFRQQRCF
jgi:uncharacterized membrane protein YphA (DoxX/SURF4 family)